MSNACSSQILLLVYTCFDWSAWHANFKNFARLEFSYFVACLKSFWVIHMTWNTQHLKRHLSEIRSNSIVLSCYQIQNRSQMHHFCVAKIDSLNDISLSLFHSRTYGVSLHQQLEPTKFLHFQWFAHNFHPCRLSTAHAKAFLRAFIISSALETLIKDRSACSATLVIEDANFADAF